MSSITKVTTCVPSPYVASYSLERAFQDVISADYDSALYLINKKELSNIELGKQYGIELEMSGLFIVEKRNLKKRRDWLWYLSSTGQYAKLDKELNTGFCFSYVRCLERQDKFRVRRMARSSSDGFLFSKHGYLINDDPNDTLAMTTEDLYGENVECLLYNMECKWWKRPRECRHELFDDIMTQARVYNETCIPTPSEIDSRDYIKMNDIALRLRNFIMDLESKRKRLSIQLRLLSSLIKAPKTCATPEVGMELTDMTDFSEFQGNVEESAGGDVNVVKNDTAHNVVLTETEISQREVTGYSHPGWSALSSSDTVSSMDTLVNRWFRVNTYIWNTQHLRNTDLIALQLPRGAVLPAQNMIEQPISLPFKIHRYWRGNMRVKVHINCNKFQIGQLQISWYYQPTADYSFNYRNNVYTRSGTHHTIISAAPNNEVEMFIPFKSYRSMIHSKTFTGDNKELPLNLGTLYITVLSPLKVNGETSPSCSFTVFVKLEDNEFTGMLAANLDTPASYQMDMLGMAVPLVEKLLTNCNNDSNRDNPPVNVPPSYLVPTASHSWSIGTDLSEPINNLRLSGRAQTNHMDNEGDEMKIDYIKRKFMLQSIFSWSQQQSPGTILFNIPVNPIPPKTKLPILQTAGVNVLATYQLSPVGFLSTLYYYWRGSLEYRFDIVASQFHSGKLLLAYIPGIDESKEITLSQARASPHIVISLDNAMSYTWTVPYISDKPWWPRRYAGESTINNYESPSKMFVFVLNELVLAETVADSIEILMYVRAGDDFEFSVPVQPSVGLGYDRTYVSSRNTNNVYPVTPTDTYYSGDWVGTGSATVQVLRRGTTSNAYAVFTEPILDRIVVYMYSVTTPLPPYARALNSTSSLVPLQYFIILVSPSSYGGYVAVPIYHIPGNTQSTDRLNDIINATLFNNFTFGDWMNALIINGPIPFGFISNTISTTDNTYGGGKNIPLVAVTQIQNIEDLEMPEFQGNREEEFASVNNSSYLVSTGQGALMFGERFSDLKDLTRRYQIYGLTEVQGGTIATTPGLCSFNLPVLPQGLNLDIRTVTSTNQVWNRAREGHIPLILSLFRFYRGSVRMRFVFTNGAGLSVWMQHRPDRMLGAAVITPCTEVTTAEAVFNHAYSVYIQDLDVNRVVELEIPFYQAANYGLLQQPVPNSTTDFKNFYSLGELSIGFFGRTTAAVIDVSIFYSLADDFRASTYQGIPPMVLLDDLPEYQMNDEAEFQMFSIFKKTPTVIGEEIARGSIDKVKEDIEPLLHGFLEEAKEKLGCVFSDAAATVNDFGFKEKFGSIASHLVHILNNPTPSTIAISIVSILAILGLLVWSTYEAAKSCLVEIWTWLSEKLTPKKQREGGEGQPVEVAEEAPLFQNDVASNAATGFLTIVCGGLCTVFGVKKDIVSHKFDGDVLFKNIDKGMKMSNVVFVFLRNLFSVLGDMKSIIVNYMYPGFNASESLMRGRDIIEQWYNASSDLLHPLRYQNLKYDQDAQRQLYDLYSFGKILRTQALDTQYPAIIGLISEMYAKLHKATIDLVASGVDPCVRKMPFTIYNYGLPEVGKSHLTSDICTELLGSEDITPETTPICVLNPSSKHWDNCDRQPCLVIDDIFAVRKGTMLEDQIAAVFNVYSPVVLIPPKAAVEDKGRAYNPEIFIMNSNEAFFKTEVCRSDALWRRRDILIHTELDTDFSKEDCRHCIEKLKVDGNLPVDVVPLLKDYHHLKFKYTYDVTNENAIFLPDNRYLKYPELLELLKKQFAENRKTEQYKFAKRVEKANEVCQTRSNFISQIDDLQTKWNDAIARRKNHETCVRSNTWTALLKEFSQRMVSEFSENKHKLLKQIYNVVQPNNNRYFNINTTCEECMRIKYQCVACRMRLEKLMRDRDLPGPSTSSSIEIVDPIFGDIDRDFSEEELSAAASSVPTFQMDEEPCYMSPYDFDLPESTLNWLVSFPTIFSVEHMSHFKEFLEQNCAVISCKLRTYPRYMRSKTIFKNICEGIVDPSRCKHHPYYNIPVFLKNAFCFVNPSDIEHPQPINNFVCISRCCYFQLPWLVSLAAQKCGKSNHPSEPWMAGLVVKTHIDVSFWDRVFGNMLMYIHNFYVNTLKPLAKKIYMMFTTIDGWIGGLAFLGILFSVVTSGTLCYAITKELTSPDVNMTSMQYKPKMSIDSMGNNALTYQDKHYSDVSKGKVNKRVKPKIPVKSSTEPEYQSCQQFDIVEKRLDANIVTIRTVVEEMNGLRVFNSSCLMLNDRRMLIEHHYWTFWRQYSGNVKFYLIAPNHGSFAAEGILILELLSCRVDWLATPNTTHLDSNFGIVHLPQYVPCFKNIVKFIATASDHEYLQTREVYLYNCLDRRTKHCNLAVKENHEMTDQHCWLRLDTTYAYQYTGKGMCGSVLLSRTLERPIIGMHFAGTTTVGFAEPLCQESFVDAVEIPSEYVFDSVELAMEDAELGRIDFSTALYPEGKLPNEFAHHQGGDTQYIPSLIQGILCPNGVVDTEPNPLSKSDLRLPIGSEPFKSGCEHMGKFPYDFEDELVNPAAEDLKDMLLNNVIPIRQTVGLISYQDAICGNKRIPGFEPLEWSTSPGFPLKTLRPKGLRGKKWLFDLQESDEGFILRGMHGELKRQLKLAYNYRKNGKRVPTIFTNCLKDTCIDSQKCRIPGKTRIFSISPVQFTIEFKRYFGDFLASYQAARLQAEHGIGINVDSLEWTQLAEVLTAKGPNIVAGDYKNFGPSLMRKIVKKCFDAIMAWYARYDPDVERQRIRRVLISEIIEAKYLCLDVVCTTPCGIPSGSPITTPLNSLVNCMYIRCAWLAIVGLDFEEFRKHVSLVTYGDDICMNVSSKYLELFNTDTLNVFFLKYNIVFTDIDKTDKIIKYRNLDNVTFLKRGFKKHPRLSCVWLAPIEEQSIRKCVSWISRKGDSVLNTLENCVQACELAFGHGPEYYNNVKETLSRECIVKLHASPRIPSWIQKSERCYNT
uniref:Genome polyprotein n=1 Tax=Giant panda Iflavirus TaxID=2903095 RepID=A0A8K1ZLQ3_9VIRU|nr:MAG: polyprotein [Giant panda Iflavirus]